MLQFLGDVHVRDPSTATGESAAPWSALCAADPVDDNVEYAVLGKRDKYKPLLARRAGPSYEARLRGLSASKKAQRARQHPEMPPPPDDE